MYRVKHDGDHPPDDGLYLVFWEGEVWGLLEVTRRLTKSRTQEGNVWFRGGPARVHKAPADNLPSGCECYPVDDPRATTCT